MLAGEYASNDGSARSRGVRRRAGMPSGVPPTPTTAHDKPASRIAAAGRMRCAGGTGPGSRERPARRPRSRLGPVDPTGPSARKPRPFRQVRLPPAATAGRGQLLGQPDGRARRGAPARRRCGGNREIAGSLRLRPCSRLPPASRARQATREVRRFPVAGTDQVAGSSGCPYRRCLRRATATSAGGWSVRDASGGNGSGQPRSCRDGRRGLGPGHWPR